MSTLMKFDYFGQILQFEEGASYPALRPIEKMQSTERTAGGTLKIENLGITIRKRTLNFEDMLKTDHDKLKEWFDNIVNASENTFQFTDERGFVGSVKITDNQFLFSEDDFELFSGVLNLEYV